MLENNKILEAAKMGKTPNLASIILMPFIFTILLSIGIGIASIIGVGVFGSNETELNLIYLQYMQYATSFAIAGGGILLFVTYIEKRNVESLGFFNNHPIASYLKGMVIASIGILLVISVLQFKGEISLTVSTLPIGINGIVLFVLILIAWIIQGAAEEILVRGYMFQSIAVKYGAYKGIIFSSIVFSLLHLGNSGVTTISLINILMCGLMLCLLVLKEENIWGACGFHTTWNLLQGNVFGINVSGNALDISLFQTHIGEPSIWNGGAFGMEGSILTTIFMVLVSGILIWQLSKKTS